MGSGRTTKVMLGAMAIVLAVAATASAQQTINPTGGTTAGDGLRIVIETDATFQIYREGARQLYNAEGPSMAAGTTMNGLNFTGWTAVSQTAVTGSGSSVSPWQVTTVVGNAAGFQISHSISYTLGDAFFDLEAVVTPPAGNTEIVKLYHLVDTYLSGGDNGSAYAQPATGTPNVLGVTRDGQYEVFIVGNRAWDRYYSAYYDDQYGEVMGGGDLSNTLDPDVGTDNGIGVQWTLGVITTPQTIRYRMSFSTVATPPVCGDGAIAGIESCDDGNAADADGCSSLCQIEEGYDCTGAPSVCATSCGDGARGGSEACDDGNTTDGDGCTLSCTLETGWSCSGSPTVCAADCGDGLLVGAESCDDGNTIDSDGCSPACAVEAGYECAGTPSVCDVACGDGLLLGGESCDDGNTTDGDGCSSACAVEAGYACAGEPSVCDVSCGDGVTAGPEACDDGNTDVDDGCSDVCAVESGWSCGGSPSTCTLDCGDGTVAGMEDCDDGDTAAGDGCAADCTVEEGFQCEGEPSVCSALPVADAGVDAGADAEVDAGADAGADAGRPGSDAAVPDAGGGTGSDAGAPDAGGGTDGGGESGGCGCITIGGASAGGWVSALLGLALVAMIRRRRRD